LGSIAAGHRLGDLTMIGSVDLRWSSSRPIGFSSRSAMRCGDFARRIVRDALQGEGPAGAKVVGFRRPDGRYGVCKRAWVRGDQRFADTTAESRF
jgi:hypothetical protein